MMINDLETGNTGKIYDIRVSKHNGANAFWVNDSFIALKVSYMTGEKKQIITKESIIHSFISQKNSITDKEVKFEAVFINLSEVDLSRL